VNLVGKRLNLHQMVCFVAFLTHLRVSERTQNPLMRQSFPIKALRRTGPKLLPGGPSVQERSGNGYITTQSRKMRLRLRGTETRNQSEKGG